VFGSGRNDFRPGTWCRWPHRKLVEQAVIEGTHNASREHESGVVRIVWSRQEGHRRRRTTSSPTRPGRGAGSPKDQRRQSVGCKKRAGSFPALLDQGLVIPNSDGAGVIEAVAMVSRRAVLANASGSTRLNTADASALRPGMWRSTRPVPCDFPTTPASRLAHVWHPVMTAHRCVFADGPVDRQVVLVTGGAGRVGYYAVQWAKAAGRR